MRSGCLRCVFLLVLALVPWSARSLGADKLSDLQKQFDRESQSGGKIKALDKLGQAQFEAATEAGKKGDYVTVGLILEKYRDNVREAFALLRKEQPDADRHPGNYRQLEIEVRRGIREVEETLLVAPPEVHPPLELVHQDLIDVDDSLIHLLFPRRTKDPVKVPPAPEEKP